MQQTAYCKSFLTRCTDCIDFLDKMYRPNKEDGERKERRRLLEAALCSVKVRTIAW